MYCKNCGKQIPGDSKFCNNCGTLQQIPQYETRQNQVIDPKSLGKLEAIFGIQLTRKIIGYYLVWLMIHLVMLLINWESSGYSHDYFYPFTKRSEIEHYDFTEFLFYTIVPLIILVTINLFKTANTSSSSKGNLNLEYDLTYKKDNDPTFVGVSLLIIYFFSYIIIQSSTLWNEVTVVFTVFSTIVRIIVIIWIAKIAKKLNRSSLDWGFFAFIFPAIALIVIGQLKKLKSPK